MGIGRITTMLTDLNRREEIGDFDGNRRIPLSIIYPSSKETTEELYKDLYYPKIELLNKIYSEGSEEKEKFLDELKIAYENNAPIKEGKYPVVIFSHGLTADRDFFTFLFEKLVSNGFIVVSVGHIYDTDYTLLPSGEVVEMKKGIDKDVSVEERAKQLQVRRDDVVYVHDHLNELNELKEINNCIDTENIFIGGHSLGAVTTFYAGLVLDDLKGCFTFDMPVHLIDIKLVNQCIESKHLPFLNIYRYFKNPQNLKLMNNIIQMKCLNPVEYTIMIKETDHLSFTDWYKIYPEKYNHSYMHLVETHKIISTTVLTFLKDILDNTTKYNDLLESHKEDTFIIKADESKFED